MGKKFYIVIMIVVIALLLISCNDIQSNTDNSQDAENLEQSETNINIPTEDKDEVYTGTVIEDKDETIIEDKDKTDTDLTIDKLNYLDTNLDEFKILNLEGLSDEKEYRVVQKMDGNVIISEQYQFNVVNYYLYNLEKNSLIKMSSELMDSHFLNINDSETLSIRTIYGNDTSNSSIGIYSWDYSSNLIKYIEFSLDLKNIEYVDSEYYNGYIYIAITANPTGQILKIDIENNKIDYYEMIYASLGYTTDVLVVNDNNLYAIAEGDIVYQYDKEKNEFIRLDSLSMFVKEEYKYYVKNRNEFKIYNSEYSAEFTLPYVEEDSTLCKGSLYHIEDSYNKNQFIIAKGDDPHGFLYIYTDNNIKEIPIINSSYPFAKFINSDEIIYEDDDNLYKLNIITLEKSLISKNISFILGNKIYETDESIYFFLYDSSILKYKK